MDRKQPTRGRARGRVRGGPQAQATTSSSGTDSTSTTPGGTISSSSTPTPPSTPGFPSHPVTPTHVAPVAVARDAPGGQPQPSTSTASIVSAAQAGMQQLSVGSSGPSGSTVHPVIGPSAATVQYSRYTYKVTKPAGMAKTTPIAKDQPWLKLVANYYPAVVAEGWTIHQYAVTFDPPLEDEQTMQRRGLFKTVSSQLPSNLFDGLMLFTTKELSPCPMVLLTKDKFTNAPVTIIIDSHKELDRRDPVCFQIYNIFVRKCLSHCNFVEMGRKYFEKPNDPKYFIPSHKIEIWPGFSTSLRFYEDRLLLNVEQVSKVICTKTALDIINEKRVVNRTQREDVFRGAVEFELVDRTMLTLYNNRTYPIDAVLWDEHPTDTFPWKDGTTKDYVTYYKEKYGVQIRDLKQPLLLVRLKEKEIRRGRKLPLVVKLVPETCVPTGLTDDMRNNFTLMKAVNSVVHLDPKQRAHSLSDFVNRFLKNPAIQEESQKWGINIDKNLIKVKGKLLEEQKVYQRQRAFELDPFSRGVGFRAPLHDPKQITNWVSIVPQQYAPDYQRFCGDLKSVCTTMEFKLSAPRNVFISRTQPHDYLKHIESEIANLQGKIDLMFVVLSTHNSKLYNSVKETLTMRYGIPSQCILTKNLTKGKSVATKVGVQMSCKIGGVPWIIRNPFTKEHVCIIGFDVYHAGTNGGRSYAAIVATVDKDFSRSVSFVTAHIHREEISKSMGHQIKNCLAAYKRMNGVLPNKIFFYRDGVGEGKVDIVIDVELSNAQTAITKLYKEANQPAAQLTYVIVSKRINTRFMHFAGEKEGFKNPPPGTIVDDVVTLHYRYDFFLVSQTARQGTVSPTNYNVIYDQIRLPASKLQTLTFRLCHNYYNWNGTLSVPSVCQNAHKLAYITGEAIKNCCHENLQLLPHYL